MIKIHKKTKQRLLLKSSNSLVSTLYVLDNNDNKVLHKNSFGKNWNDIHGKPVYKLAICLNKNLK